MARCLAGGRAELVGIHGSGGSPSGVTLQSLVSSTSSSLGSCLLTLNVLWLSRRASDSMEQWPMVEMEEARLTVKVLCASCKSSAGIEQLPMVLMEPTYWGCAVPLLVGLFSVERPSVDIHASC